MKFKHGLVLGKFYPPHKGHLYLIEEAKKRCDLLTVVIASLKAERIPGSLRFEWLKALTKDKDVNIVWIQDENPQYPEEDPNFWNIWKQSIEQAIYNSQSSPIDSIFSSELYGDPLGKVLGVPHELIDLGRKNFSISASQIRNEPSKYWDFIPELLRPYFLKRVVITGPESVGKSTLTQMLGDYFQTSIVEEYAREYLESKGRYVIEEDILQIGKGHLNLELEMSKQSNRILFLDTDHITTKIYSEYYFKNCPKWVELRAKNLQYDESIFLDIDVPWIADPQRDLGEVREDIKSIFHLELKKANRSYKLVSGSFLQRAEIAKSIIEMILKQPMNPIYFTEEQRNLRTLE